MLELQTFLLGLNGVEHGQVQAWKDVLNRKLGRELLPAGSWPDPEDAPGKVIPAIIQSIATGGWPTGGWPDALTELRRHLDQSLCCGEVGAASCAYCQFTLDVLETAFLDVGQEAGALIASAAISLMPDFLDGAFIGALLRTSQRHCMAGAPSGDELPTIMQRLQRRVWDRARPLAHAARREGTSLEEWRRSLARLVVALWERHSVDLKLMVDNAWLPSSEVVEAKREAAYAEEQFAHIFTSIRGGYVTEERLAQLTASASDTATWSNEDKREARESLQLMRSKYRIPAYVFTELDARFRR
jgi:hypothetical protein